MPNCDLNSQSPALSVVIPVYNEQDNVEPLLADLVSVLESMEQTWEVLIVDDGSVDDTSEVLRGLCENDARLRVITLAENRGQGAALFTGLKAAAGRVLVTLDGDRQNVPTDIPKLLEKLDGADMVVGIRQKRRDSKLRLWMSRIANGVRSKALGDGMQDSGCALKVFKREVVDALIPMQTLYSFIPALAAGGGYRVIEEPVQHRERDAGVSNYGIIKMLWRPLVDMLGLMWFNHRRSDAPERAASESAALPWLFAIAMVVLAYFAFVGNHGLLEPDEGRYAEIPREMMANQDYLVPTLNGIPHFQKPPFLYWATALSYKLFGISEWSARLPSVLGGFGTLALTFWMAHAFGGRRLALVATLILASSLEFFLLARTLTPDMTMTFWITASIASLVAYQRGRWRGFQWLFFVCMGLGFLTKGPMAVIVPCCAAIGLRFASPSGAQTERKMSWFLGFSITAAIGLSWFVAVSIKHPQLFDYFVRSELLDRFTGTSHGRSQPVWFFIPILLAGFMPWTLFMPLLGFWLWRSFRSATQVETRLLLLGWLVPPLVILSLSGSKLLTYVLPLFPALAILMSMALLEVAKWKKVPAIVLAVVLAGCGLAAVVLPHFDLTTHRIAMSPWSPVVLLGASVLLYRAAGQITSDGFVRAFGLSAIALWMVIASHVGQVNPYLKRQASVERLAEVLKLEPDIENARIVAADVRAHGFEFYLGRTVEMTEGESDAVLESTEEQQSKLHGSLEVPALESTDGAIYVLTRDKVYRKRYRDSAVWERLDREGDFVLLKQPASALVAH